MWQVWCEWSVCRDNYSHDEINLSSSFPISCQTLPKDSNNNPDIIAVSSNPQLPSQTRTPVAPKCSRQLFLYENAWRFMFGRQNLDVMPGTLKLFCVVTNVIWIYNPCFTIVVECIAAVSQVLSSTSSLQSTQYSLPFWKTCWRIIKLILNLLNNIIEDIRDSTENFLKLLHFWTIQKCTYEKREVLSKWGTFILKQDAPSFMFRQSHEEYLLRVLRE